MKKRRRSPAITIRLLSENLDALDRLVDYRAQTLGYKPSRSSVVREIICAYLRNWQ